MSARDVAFQTLKPPCVALSRAAILLHGSTNASREVISALEDLDKALSSGIALDEQLSEYVFFPLSQILQASQKTSIRSLELTLRCLSVLIEKGWRDKVSPQLASQLNIFCTLMGQRNPQGLSTSESTDDLRAAAYTCLLQLYLALTPRAAAYEEFASEANVPQLGQTISTLLDGLQESVSPEVQVNAVHALHALVNNVATPELKVAFLPGIVSRLTKILVPKATQRRRPVVLVKSLEIFNQLVVDVFRDDKQMQACGDIPDHDAASQKSGPISLPDKQWLQKGSEQLKAALITIARLKTHDREDVRAALGRLCLSILERCSETLPECCRVGLETILSMIARDSDHDLQTSLEILLIGHIGRQAFLQSIFDDWLHSLATIFQAADEQKKLDRMKQIEVAYGMMDRSTMNTAWLGAMLASAIRDCTVLTLSEPNNKLKSPVPVSAPTVLDIALVPDSQSSRSFESPLARNAGQGYILDSIDQIVRSITASSGVATFLPDLLRALPFAQEDTQVAIFWLAYTSTQTALARQHEMTDFLTFEDECSALVSRALEELYSFALDALVNNDEEHTDTRLSAIALRVMAMQAREAREDFHGELMDALYPVLHAVAGRHEQLQQDGLTTLSIFAQSCGYASVKDLIIENVDYLTNAVALKLNAFDVTPQAPQVLLMMTRLAGPRLLPYLEDTVESIFAALRDYHGYPLLVELLFKVLGVVAEEGAKLPQLAIEASAQHGKAGVRELMGQPLSIDAVAETIRARATDRATDQAAEVEPLEAHPKKPWVEEKTTVDNSLSDGEDDAGAAGSPAIPEDAETPPPAPKTYSLLLRISDLTQHFLPSASPSLRTALLALIKTTTPALAKHEDSFLPLVNTLWPEIVSRLDDTEPHLVALALDIVGEICSHAGDFMRSRVTQLWPELVVIYQRVGNALVAAERVEDAARHRISGAKLLSSSSVAVGSARFALAIRRMREAPADFTDSGTRAIWESLLRTIAIVVQHTGVSAEVCDEALELLEPVLGDPAFNAALSQANADAVWLAQVRRGLVAAPSAMELTGGHAAWKFADFVMSSAVAAK